jgi:hypothetical protein
VHISPRAIREARQPEQPERSSCTLQSSMSETSAAVWVERNSRLEYGREWMRRLELFTRSHVALDWARYTKLLHDCGYHATEQVEQLAAASVEYFGVSSWRVAPEFTMRKGKKPQWQKTMHDLLLRMPDYLPQAEIVSLDAYNRFVVTKWSMPGGPRTGDGTSSSILTEPIRPATPTAIAELRSYPRLAPYQPSQTETATASQPQGSRTVASSQVPTFADSADRIGQHTTRTPNSSFISKDSRDRETASKQKTLAQLESEGIKILLSLRDDTGRT